MTAPSNYFCMTKITEAILNKNKVCGTFIIKFCIEIHLLKDDSRYHENKWHFLLSTIYSHALNPSEKNCMPINNCEPGKTVQIWLWVDFPSKVKTVDQTCD